MSMSRFLLLLILVVLFAPSVLSKSKCPKSILPNGGFEEPKAADASASTSAGLTGWNSSSPPLTVWRRGYNNFKPFEGEQAVLVNRSQTLQVAIDTTRVHVLHWSFRSSNQTNPGEVLFSIGPSDRLVLREFLESPGNEGDWLLHSGYFSDMIMSQDKSIEFHWEGSAEVSVDVSGQATKVPSEGVLVDDVKIFSHYMTVSNEALAVSEVHVGDHVLITADVAYEGPGIAMGVTDNFRGLKCVPGNTQVVFKDDSRPVGVEICNEGRPSSDTFDVPCGAKFTVRYHAEVLPNTDKTNIAAYQPKVEYDTNGRRQPIYGIGRNLTVLGARKATTKCKKTDFIGNGDFELFQVMGESFSEWMFKDSGGWQSRSTDRLQIFTSREGGFKAHSGKQFAMIKRDKPVFQNFTGAKDANLIWSFRHRSNGISTKVTVDIGPIGGAKMHKEAGMVSNEWRLFCGTYVIPKDNAEYEFQISMDGDGYIDDVSMCGGGDDACPTEGGNSGNEGFVPSKMSFVVFLVFAVGLGVFF